MTALVGRSGCGKTTLLNLAGAMDFPTTGEVLIGGRATNSLSDAELTALAAYASPGSFFNRSSCCPHAYTVLENVELPLLLARAPKAAETAMERLRWVDLEAKAASFPYQLSGGQMQRAAIARALAHSPEIVIADEPTGNLDNASGGQILALLRRCADEFGAAVLIATHSAEAAAIADVRVKLRDGRME